MRQGFSLLELSIVLVIIGLITGGIMAGRSMVRAAELRSVMSDLQKFQTSINTFREKYNGFPGDLKNATSYWGSAGGTGADATCSAVASTTAATCNGDGNGQVLNSSGGVLERYRAWQHMANAGLIEGQYTGALDAAGGMTPGLNMPVSKISSNIGFEFQHYTTMMGNIGHMLKLGGAQSGGGLNYAALPPVDAQAIDQKLDDGKADSGKVNAIDSTNQAGCVSGGTALVAPSSYILTNSVVSCRLYQFID